MKSSIVKMKIFFILFCFTLYLTHCQTLEIQKYVKRNCSVNDLTAVTIQANLMTDTLCASLCSAYFARNRNCSGFSNDESSCSMVFVTQSNLDSNSSSQKELFVNTKMEEKSGYVALIAGGIYYDGYINLDSMSLYSPEGGCNYNLPAIPKPLNEPVLFQILNQIYICHGYVSGQPTVINQNCWKYDFSSLKWLQTASSKYSYFRKRGIVYKNKLYMLNDQAGMSEVYDPITDTWTTWSISSPPAVGLDPCVVQWKDGFILIGGESDLFSVRLYNFTTNAWKNLKSRGQRCAGCGCIILPQNQNQMLVLSTDWQDPYRADIYDILTDTWKPTGKAKNNHNGVVLCSLGKRVFAIGGYPNGNQVEEFNYQNGSWSILSNLMSVSMSYSDVISSQAALFDNCSGVI